MAKKSKKRLIETTDEPHQSSSAETRVRRVEAEPAENDSTLKRVVIAVLLLLGLLLLLNFFMDRPLLSATPSSPPAKRHV